MSSILNFRNYYRDIEKLNKELEKKFNKQLKKKKSLTYEALKFEYQALYKIVEEEIENMNQLVVFCAKSKCYLLKMHEYYQSSELMRTSEELSLELISSFVLAVAKEPVFVSIIKKNKLDEANIVLMQNVIKRANIKLKSDYTETLGYYINLYEETNNEVYIVAASIVKEYFSE